MQILFNYLIDELINLMDLINRLTNALIEKQLIWGKAAWSCFSRRWLRERSPLAAALGPGQGPSGHEA